MNWQTTLDRELDRIAEARLLMPGPAPFSLNVPHGCLRCELAAVDTIGCAFLQLWLETDALAQVTVEQLRRLSQSLTKRLSYLLEPISNLELDDEGFSMQLRSHPPQQDEGGRRYYELTVRRGGEVRLCRYVKNTGQPREIVLTTITREVLCRLAGDLDAALASCLMPDEESSDEAKPLPS